jgi:hypothetical protein
MRSESSPGYRFAHPGYTLEHREFNGESRQGTFTDGMGPLGSGRHEPRFMAETVTRTAIMIRPRIASSRMERRANPIDAAGL